MGLFDIFKKPYKLADFAASAPVSFALESPNQSSSLAKVVYAEYFVGENAEVTRDSALQIPAFKKARDVYVSIIAGFPLREYADGVETDTRWLRNTKTGISPWHRIAGVIDDILWYDWSAVAVERDASGQIIDAVRIPFERWDTDQNGHVLVDGSTAPANRVVLIPGNGSGGWLTAGAPTIRGYHALQKAWVGRAQNPIPIVELHQINDDEMTDGSEDPSDDEIGDLLASWSAARMAPGGAVGFTDNRVELRTHGDIPTDLYENARNAAVLDIARLVGIPAAVLDGSQSTASLTYSTQEGHANEFAMYSLPMYTGPIEARLSLDDVSPEGHVIRFDRSDFQTPAPAAVTQPQED